MKDRQIGKKKHKNTIEKIINNIEKTINSMKGVQKQMEKGGKLEKQAKDI